MTSRKPYDNMAPLERFAAYIVGKLLYDYQVEAANAIPHCIENNEGATTNLIGPLGGIAISVYFDGYEEMIKTCTIKS